MRLALNLFALSLGLALLPAVVLFSGWHWQVAAMADQAPAWLWLTLSGSFPMAIMTSLLVLAWLKWRLGWSWRTTGLHGLCLACALVAGQGVKGVLKHSFQEPRPYVQYLDQQHQGQFYHLDGLAQERLIDAAPIPGWLKGHWRAERGYSLPSGHTQFAVTLALFAIVLFWRARAWLSGALMLAWALAMMASRLVLGMHWPLDLLLSLSFSWLLVWPALAVSQSGRQLGKISDQ